MAETKTCSKCGSAMKQGKILKYNEHTVRNQYIYVFAPDEEPGPDLSRAFCSD